MIGLITGFLASLGMTSAPDRHSERSEESGSTELGPIPRRTLPSTTLASIIRLPATLQPEDSVLRAVEVLRYGGIDTVPVVDESGTLRGVVMLADLRPIIEQSPENDGNMLCAPI